MSILYWYVYSVHCVYVGYGVVYDVYMSVVWYVVCSVVTILYIVCTVYIYMNV